MKPVMTYADCLTACRQNVATAIERQGRCEGAYQERMAVEATHWRGYVHHYERLIAENPALADKPVNLGSFGKAPSVRQAASSASPKGETAAAPQTQRHAQPIEFHEREPGEDDGDGSSIPF